MTEAAYRFSKERIGELECGIVQPADQATPITSLSVFCHGYGANGDDLVGLAPELLQIAPVDGAMLVFPEAPISLADEGMPDGKAWWKLSIQRLLSAIDTGQYELIREEVPDGVDEAREKLVATINKLLQRCGLGQSQLMLAGFSQGGMLSVDVALRGLDVPPAKLCLYSTCLVCERIWKPLAARLSASSIFQSHGRIDPILPLQTGKWLTGMLEAQECEVDYFEFNGVHTIPMQAIEKTAALLAELSDESCTN